MPLIVDFEKLERRKAELEKELANIKGLIELAENYCTSLVNPVVKVTSSKPEPEENYPRRGFTAGLRRAVILALHTGQTNEKDLAKGLAWSLERTHAVVSSMLKFKICYLNSVGNLALSDEGKKQAEWYLRHSNMLCYRPSEINK
jgi:hypothetical protein